MEWDLIFRWAFLVALLTTAIRLAVPVLLAAIGEIITERSGVLNMGLEGCMMMGAVTGFLVAYNVNLHFLGGGSVLSSWIGLAAGMVAGGAFGLVMAILSISLKADQTISGVTLVLFGTGLANYLYRNSFSALVANTQGMKPLSIPYLSDIPILGEILFRQDPTVYLTFVLVILVWFFLIKTTWGLDIRAVGENPAAAETSGINVSVTRYIATILGSSLAGLGGAVLTVVQLKLFREGITSGRGWIAIALVIFARWKPGLALVGTLLFGLADSLQYRIQALSTVQHGSGVIPYEFLLMFPYLLTLFVLYFRSNRQDAPKSLGRPHERGSGF